MAMFVTVAVFYVSNTTRTHSIVAIEFKSGIVLTDTVFHVSISTHIAALKFENGDVRNRYRVLSINHHKHTLKFRLTVEV